MRHVRLRSKRLDAGESLIEILVTISILGIAVVALMGALLVGVQTSVLHRKSAQAQSELRSWAEQVSSSYADCAGPDAFAPPSVPSGFSASVSQVQYWNGSAFVDSPCNSSAGLQRVTLVMTVAAGIHPGFTETLRVVVRKPCATSC